MGKSNPVSSWNGLKTIDKVLVFNRIMSVNEIIEIKTVVAILERAYQIIATVQVKNGIGKRPHTLSEQLGLNAVVGPINQGVVMKNQQRDVTRHRKIQGRQCTGIIELIIGVEQVSFALLKPIINLQDVVLDPSRKHSMGKLRKREQMEPKNQTKKQQKDGKHPPYNSLFKCLIINHFYLSLIKR